MNEPLNSLFDFHKRAEISHIGDFAFNPVAGFMFFIQGFQRMRLHLFESQRDALLLRIDIQDTHRHFFSRFEDFFWMDHLSRPCQIGNMNQAFHTGFKLYKSSEIG